ncbi:MAG: PrsW family intramembrane metalloprotease [Flavobacteriales bacterium]|nr:PrsW family intramembrane metalloprotease [Flavobacteriales bacterium]
MDIITLIFYSILALLVAILWMIYLRKVDVFQPETWKRIGITFLLGCLSVLPVLALHELFPYFFDKPPRSSVGLLFYYVFKVGLVEELSKLLFAVISLRFFIKQKEPVDYVVHAALSALGFATVENVLYITAYGHEVLIGRAAFSVLIHMVCAAVPMYFYIFTQKTHKEAESFYKLVGGLFAASIIHGLYDFSLSLSGVGFLIMMILFMMSLEFWLTIINNLLNISPHFKKNVSPDYSAIQNTLLIGFILLYVFDFVFSFYLYDWDLSTIKQLLRIPVGAVLFLVLLMTKLSKIRLIPGKEFPLLYQISFAFNPKTFIPNSPNGKFSSASFDARMDSVNEMEISKSLYQKVKLVSRDKPENGVIGMLADKIWAYDDEVYFKFEPLMPLQFKGYRSDFWLIKAQTLGKVFFNDKYSEAVVLLVKEGQDITPESTLKEFANLGRYYIIPSEEKIIIPPP